jgi:hypothetical protein
LKFEIDRDGDGSRMMKFDLLVKDGKLTGTITMVSENGNPQPHRWHRRPAPEEHNCWWLRFIAGGAALSAALGESFARGRTALRLHLSFSPTMPRSVLPDISAR